MTEFVLAENDRYWWPVVVLFPDPEKPGSFVEQKLSMEFELQERDDYIKSRKLVAEMTDPEEIVAHEHAELVRLSKNWSGVVGKNKEPVPFTEAALRAAIQKPWFRTGVYRAMNEAQSGEKPRLGN
ncbi:hypothetical protein [Rhizobium sp. 11_C7_N12_5]|uniref:hypothetical protein n=1 Tax=Rhizobium sp. 11_C7_N12_5 TaxID=3240770 RepID=UPI003F267061